MKCKKVDLSIETFRRLGILHKYSTKHSIPTTNPNRVKNKENFVTFVFSIFYD